MVSRAEQLAAALRSALGGAVMTAYAVDALGFSLVPPLALAGGAAAAGMTLTMRFTRDSFLAQVVAELFAVAAIWSLTAWARRSR